MEPIKLKTVLTAVTLVSGVFMMLLIGTGASASAYQAEGLALDFGERDVIWTGADLHLITDPIDLLTSVCEERGFECTVIGSVVTKVKRTTAGGEVIEYESDLERKWDFWIIKKGELAWTKLFPPYRADLLGQTSCAWAYCSETETPSVGADQAGNSIFGYARPHRTVSLAPSITEMIGSLNAVSTLVGTDRYSNYPNSVVQAQIRGDIVSIGDYVNPSYELIMGTDPDIVYCDGAQYSHYEASERLRRSNVATVVLYGGESIETILDNIYIIGKTLEYDLRALSVINMLKDAEVAVIERLVAGGVDYVKGMFTLSSDKSPWVAGRYTYADDISDSVFGLNSMPDSFYGWVHVSSEIIAAADPSVIMIIMEGYTASVSGYNEVLNSLPSEWRATAAYNAADPADSQIYLLCDKLAEMASRPGPRYMQLMEIVAMILHPYAFDVQLPKYIGNEYEDYLTITSHLGFNS